MIVTLSPAKLFLFEHPKGVLESTKPLYEKEALALNDLLKRFSSDEFMDLMSINPELARGTFEYVHSFDLPREEEYQAGFVYNGMAYQGLDIQSLSKEDLLFAQSHLRILSGLYGILSPLDKIKPYRLEMQTKLKNKSGDDLYAFWKTKLTAQLNALMKEQDTNVWVNLTSKEYAKVIDRKQLTKGTKIITPVFKEAKGDGYKQVVVYVKKARGMMARFIVENQLVDSEHIKAFDSEGYCYSKDLSSEKEWVFIR